MGEKQREDESMADPTGRGALVAPDLEELALDDDRRVKTLSPSALVFRRFTRNRLAIVGSVIITAMFLFSFAGGFITPYGESQLFYADILAESLWVSAEVRDDIIIYTADPGAAFSTLDRVEVTAAAREGRRFAESDGRGYMVEEAGDAWRILLRKEEVRGRIVGGEVMWASSEPAGLIADANAAREAGRDSFEHGGSFHMLLYGSKDVAICSFEDFALATRFKVTPIGVGPTVDYAFMTDLKAALAEGRGDFGDGYGIVSSHEGPLPYMIIEKDGAVDGVLSPLVAHPARSGGSLTLDDWVSVHEAVTSGWMDFTIGETHYVVELMNGVYSIKTDMETRVVSRFEPPSATHWLGTDTNGMDNLTRLMYGGRISLMVGFIVVLIGSFLGIVLGGIAGYFGKAADMAIMRAVDVFNCIPGLPLYIILGALMSANEVETYLRIYILMALMGLMSWPGIARMVRGQILSFREQEFMIAAEALGIRHSRRIFRHLIPNVIPQLIVIATMDLGGVILTESTLSFLGLGVQYPLASWGNILNGVSDVYTMTNYLFAWIPAGALILITVLGFNFIGDGLRDAFDPKTKR